MIPTAHPALLHVRKFAATPDQIRRARRFLAELLNGCPAAYDAITVLSELATNTVTHSASSAPGGTFTVSTEICPGERMRIEVRDDGGPGVSATRTTAGCTA